MPLPIAGGDFHSGVVTINIRDANNHYLETTKGWLKGQRVPILAHELGHVFSRINDEGPEKILNVNLNENPIRKELGYPLRTQYGKRIVVTDPTALSGRKPGVYELDSTGGIKFRVGDLPGK